MAAFAAPNDGIKIERLPEAKAKKTISLNPSCVHGEPKAIQGQASSADLPAWSGVGLGHREPRRQLGPLLGPLRQVSIKDQAPQATGSPRREKGTGKSATLIFCLLICSRLCPSIPTGST